MTNIFWKTSSIIPTISSTFHNFYILILSQPFLTVLYGKFSTWKSKSPISHSPHSFAAPLPKICSCYRSRRLRRLNYIAQLLSSAVKQLPKQVFRKFKERYACHLILTTNVDGICLLKKRWTQVVTFLSLNSKSAMKKDCDHVSSPFFSLIYNATWPKR